VSHPDLYLKDIVDSYAKMYYNKGYIDLDVEKEAR